MQNVRIGLCHGMTWAIEVGNLVVPTLPQAVRAQSWPTADNKNGQNPISHLMRVFVQVKECQLFCDKFAKEEIMSAIQSSQTPLEESFAYKFIAYVANQ